MTTKTLTSLLIGALLAVAASAYADESPIQVAMEDGKTRAQFSVGDSRCVLIDDQIRCTRIAK
jgi:serine/threonine protein phosphatase PrpC